MNPIMGVTSPLEPVVKFTRDLILRHNAPETVPRYYETGDARYTPRHVLAP